MIDAFSSLSSDLSQMLLTQLIIRCLQPQPDLVMRLLSHISEFSKPHQVIDVRKYKMQSCNFHKQHNVCTLQKKIVLSKNCCWKIFDFVVCCCSHCWWKVHVHIYAYVTLISVSWYFDLVCFLTKFHTHYLQQEGEK